MAAIGSGTWDEAVAATGKGVKSQMGLMFSPGESWKARQINGFLGAPREVVSEYAAHWIQRDAWMKAAADSGKFRFAGAVLSGNEVLPEKELLRTDFYNDFCRRWGGYDIVSLNICDASDSIALPTYLSFHRSKEEGFFDDTTRRFLLDLWPHIQRAVQTYWRLEKARAYEIAPGLLEQIPSAVFVVRLDGKLDYANPAGASILRSLGERGSGGRLISALPGIPQAEFKGALHQCTRGLSYGRAATVAKGDGSAVRLHLNFVPVVADPALALHWPNSCALITIDQVDVAWDVQQRLQQFCASKGLTRKESAVLALLIQGLDVPTIADVLRLGYATARTHVASILAKTGCSRQTELLAKVLGAG